MFMKPTSRRALPQASLSQCKTTDTHTNGLLRKTCAMLPMCAELFLPSLMYLPDFQLERLSIGSLPMHGKSSHKWEDFPYPGRLPMILIIIIPLLLLIIIIPPIILVF
jgi:hypothetical protein